MNLYTMIVAVVFLALVGTLLILQQVKGLRAKKGPSDIEQKLQVQVEALELRVQTLERIATDTKSQLKQRIDSL